MSDRPPAAVGRATRATRLDDAAGTSGSVDPRRARPPGAGSTASRHLRVAARALGSLLVGGAAIVAPVVLVRQGLIPLIDAIFRPGPEWLGVFRRAGILVAAILGYFAYVHWHEKRRATELRLQPARLLLGGASGALLVAAPIALLFAIGAYQRVAVRGIGPELLGVASLIAIAATLEELVHRGLLFRVLERAWGTALALPVQGVLFALPHIENLERGGAVQLAVMLLSVTMLGMLWAALFVLTRNLWVASANHAAWNFTILLSGVPLSGIEEWRALAPIESRYAGPDWLTGGAFGPESSALVIASVTAAVVALWRAARRRGALRGPTA